MKLTETEHWILTFEHTWSIQPRHRTTRAQKYRDALAAGWTDSQNSYYLHLNRALAKPEAEVEFPDLVRRYRASGEQRRAERNHPLRG